MIKCSPPILPLWIFNTIHLEHYLNSIHNYIMRFTITAISLIALSSSVYAGPIAWGLCQTACNAGWGVCCVGAGGVAGKSFTLVTQSTSALVLPPETDIQVL